MKELRVGLVLFGGVSLAVYMNGVITELWNLLRVTHRNYRINNGAATAAAESGDKFSRTADCYRQLLAELEREHGAPRLQVVVDAVAGSSAGGLCGAALAKAVVEGANPTELNKTWIEKADIATLKTAPHRLPLWPAVVLYVILLLAWVDRVGPTLRRLLTRLPPRVKRTLAVAWAALDRAIARFPQPLLTAGVWLGWVLRWLTRFLGRPLRAIESLPGIGLAWTYRIFYTMITTTDGRVTPLNGSSFTRMIAESFQQMAHRKGDPLLPPLGTFDLFLTSTDLCGWPRHLPVSATHHRGTLYEATHAHVTAFRHRPWASGPANQLDDFALTFASRSTAGFPGAFAPVSCAEGAADFSIGAAVGPPNLDAFARRHLREHELAGFPVASAWMVDGGILNNKPFSYVTAAIEDKPADHEVYRIIIYIEPDPEPAPSEHLMLDPETRIARPPSAPPPNTPTIRRLTPSCRH